MNTTNLRLVRAAALMIVGLVGVPAHAQAPSLLFFSGDTIFESGLSAPDSDEELSPSPDAETRVSTFLAGFNIPIKLSDRAVLMVGGRYELMLIRQDGAREIVPDEFDLHVASASLLFNYKITDSWSLSLQAAPGLAGDFVNVNGDHFRMNGAAIAQYEFSKRFALGFGVLVNWQFGEPLPLPAIRLQWRIVDSLQFTAFLPAQAALTWRPVDRIELGLAASVRGQSYALTSDRIRGRWPCTAQEVDNPETVNFNESEANPDLCFDTLAYSRVDVGPTVAVRIVSSLWLSVRAAYTVLRRYDFINDDGETPDIGNLELDNNFLVQGQLSWRIPGS